MRRVGSTNSVLLLSAFGPSEGAEFSIPHERSLAMSDMMKAGGGYLREGGLKWFGYWVFHVLMGCWVEGVRG